MSNLIPKGLFIALEGVDRSGKSTQAERLTQKLNEITGKETLHIRFPDRTTSIGKGIAEYLKGNDEMEPHANHLLFTANRWELQDKIREALKKGQCVVADRYLYSGIVYSAAKDNAPEWEWCKSVENGLIKADCVICLIPEHIEDLEKRQGFGEERFEKTEFQVKVMRNYQRLAQELGTKSNSENKNVAAENKNQAVVNCDGQQWHFVTASGKSIDDIHNCIMSFLEPELVNACLMDESETMEQ